jgi:hypothetical protein
MIAPIALVVKSPEIGVVDCVPVYFVFVLVLD